VYLAHTTGIIDELHYFIDIYYKSCYYK